MFRFQRKTKMPNVSFGHNVKIQVKFQAMMVIILCQLSHQSSLIIIPKGWPTTWEMS